MDRNILAVDVGESFENALDDFFAFLPRLLAFLIILVIGWIVASLVRAAVRKLLEKLGVDRHVRSSQANQYVERAMPGASPSSGIARVVFLLVFAFFFFTAIGALNVPALTDFMNDVLAYLPNIIVAIVIFVVAAVVSGAVAAGIAKVMGDTTTGKVAATVVPALVMVIALFMILEQLNIAPEIVRIAFGATMFALALGLALAFGLGGRSVAQRMLEDAYDAGQRNKGQIAQDLQAGRDRAKAEAQSAAGGSGSGAGTTPGATPTTGQPTTQSFSSPDDPRRTP